MFGLSNITPSYAVLCQFGVVGVTGENSVFFSREKNLPKRGLGMLHENTLESRRGTDQANILYAGRGIVQDDPFPPMLLRLRLARPPNHPRAVKRATPNRAPMTVPALPPGLSDLRAAPMVPPPVIIEPFAQVVIAAAVKRGEFDDAGTGPRNPRPGKNA